MRIKIVTNHYFFEQLTQEIEDKLGYNFELKLFTAIPGITKTDILEFLEYMVIANMQTNTEIWVAFLEYAMTACDCERELNSVQPNYADDYIHIIGQLFLAGYIDFVHVNAVSLERQMHTPSLSSYKKDQIYEMWKYFRDNFIYGKLFDNICDFEDKKGDFWADAQKNWNGYNIDVILTEQGEEYFEKILIPKVHHKYKDIELEIDEEGQILAWYKNGDKM